MRFATATRPFVLVWAAAWIGAVASQLTTGIVFGGTYANDELLFGVVMIAASLCAVFSVALIVRGLRQGTAEVALLGCFLTATSLLPLVHGLLIPGIIYGDNTAARFTVQLTVPLSALALIPLIGRSGRWPRWRTFVLAHLVVTAGFAATMLAFPQLAPVLPTGSTGAVAIAALSLSICFAVSIRHLHLAVISQKWQTMALPLGLILIGTAPLIFVVGGRFSAAFWLAHVLDVTGVLLAGGAGLIALRRGATTTALLAPIEAATPLRSLELGLDPLVHRFVGDLDRKDPVTREHVIRTARLAVLVATEMRLAPMQVRNVGLGAILHDVGKLDIPDDILNKPGRLTDAEFETIKEHPVTGDAMVRTSPALHAAAPLVRGHHERVDGRGYPDRLTGDEIPLGARVVAACDAFDAMANTRQYRKGMDRDRVVAILREHRGSQWDAEVIDALLRVIANQPIRIEEEALGDVGRDHEPACCRDALPV